MPALKNPRWEAMAQEVFKDPGLDQWVAAQRAGFKGTQKVLSASAGRLMMDVAGNPSPVRARIMELQGRVAEKAILTRADLLNSLAPVITTIDIGKFYFPDGSPKPIAELDDDCRAAIKSMSVAVSGKKRRTVAITEMERFDRRPYVETYAKIAGYLKDQVELTGAGGKPLFPQRSPRDQARRLAFLLARAARQAQEQGADDKPKG